jgi:hypothetical protein
VRSCADEIDPIAFKLIDEQEVSADVTFAVVGPIALEGMVGKEFRDTIR